MHIKHMLSLLFIYLLVLLLAFLLQRKMIFYPEIYTLQEKHTAFSKTTNLRPWPAQENYRGFISNNKINNSKGTILIFHGNAGSARGRRYFIDALENLGYKVILAEYPGYGSRQGQPSEQVMVDDALITTHLAMQEFAGPLYLWGESLGAGVVSAIVSSGKFNIQGITLIAPFDNLPNIAQHHYPFLLGRLLTLDKFDNIRNLEGYTGSVAILLAMQDKVIPNKFSMNLINKLSCRKKIWEFPGADHNTIPVSPDLPWWAEVMQFLDQQKENE